MPPSILSNADLGMIMETNDDWITSRTGIRERRVSHVSGTDLAWVASARALACAGVAASEVELIVYGSCSNDEQIPNTASGLQFKLGAARAAAMDVNTACTSFLYALSTASAMIRTGVVKNALVVGVEVITPFMDWTNRNVAVLFGDGAAAVLLQASDHAEGVLGERLGCFADARQTLRVRGTGLMYANGTIHYGDTQWDFDGQEIFKRAVVGMSQASVEVLAKCGHTIDDVGLVVPHQANQRIIDFVARRLGAPADKVFLTIQRYGNMSAATVPVALVEALEEGRVAPNSLLLTPAFGGGLTWCSHLIRWGERITPKDATAIDLPAPTQSALEMVREFMSRKGEAGRSLAGLNAVRFAESP
jgi:3-oxoacyl-[acyl-carrier-protein] synthase-3